MKITSGLQTEFPQAPAMPLFHPVNCTSPFPSLCSLLTFNFSLLPSRLEKVPEQHQDEQICYIDPSFSFDSARFRNAQQQQQQQRTVFLPVFTPVSLLSGFFLNFLSVKSETFLILTSC